MAFGKVRLVALLTVALAGAAVAQDFPTRHVTMVVPFVAGGPTDVLARHLAQAMSPPLKQQVIIENVGGAGGTLGTARVAKAPPDGYTALLMHVGISTAPALYRKLPYDAVNDLEPIGRVADVPMTVVARKTLPPDNLKDFLSYAKANKDKLNYAHAGVGSSSHLCGLLLMSKIGMDFNTCRTRAMVRS
jgi:tripartite-type tricarboxylate transporter receptor subunit TctC